ncbi:Dyp-type peroxidase [Saccharopolyspora cebuensis]|uniref:Dyp-type peroxidase n=1 Tax=Saccharopolyspora cebuensis TaxID=418759 RepID=UPI0031E61B78
MPTSRIDLDEPVLDVDDIQGNILTAFNTACEQHVFLRVVDAERFPTWVARVAETVTTMRATWERRQRRQRWGPLVAIWFSYSGLLKLTETAREIQDVPFKEGLPSRSRLLGDPVSPDSPGACANWRVGGPDRVPDALLVVASEEPITDGLATAGLADRCVEVLHEEVCARLPHGNEHFGFREPVSQPGVRGRVELGESAFLTPSLDPTRPAEGAPGQSLVWPGEFVFGYPTQDNLDRIRPGPRSRAGPAWARNGSLVVVRRINQDVAAFNRFAGTVSRRLGQIPELAGTTVERVRAQLVGRWPSGVAVVHGHERDPGAAGADVNDFGYVGKWGAAGDDAAGLVCPQAAHIRKAFPRDHETSMDTAESMETHRLLRRGIPFGAVDTDGERGLMFVAFQTSLERQFEFVQRSWLNNPRLRTACDGHDPLVGQCNRGMTGPQERYFAFRYRRADGVVRTEQVVMREEWTTPTGGGYFFAPSLSALRGILSGRA